MAQADIHQVVSVPKDQFFATVLKYEDYPEFVEGCQKVKVERPGPGKARVTYEIDIMGQNIHYTLDHVEDAAKGVMTWTLVESNFVKKNVGQWEIKEVAGGKTDVRYQIDIEFNIPVPGFILNRLVKGNLPSMLKSFEEQTKKAK